jgi:hypothetical protein
MKISQIKDSTLISWIWSHSEKYNVHITPTKWAKAYSWQMRWQPSNMKPSRLWAVPDSHTVQVETLELKSIMNGIILMNEWHYFRSAADLNLPILDDPTKYQHRVLSRKMTVNRDISNSVQR